LREPGTGGGARVGWPFTGSRDDVKRVREIGPEAEALPETREASERREQGGKEDRIAKTGIRMRKGAAGAGM